VDVGKSDIATIGVSERAPTGYIVVTTVNPPSPSLDRIVALRPDWILLAVGDRGTPANWNCGGARFLSLADQVAFGSSFAEKCPYDHYARKNIGYLKAMALGAPIIAETDDDNSPYPTFLADLARSVVGRMARSSRWVNVYAYFADTRIWPRGFPLENVLSSFDHLVERAGAPVTCSIQQYLVDGDPDVDAVYRLTNESETVFHGDPLILGPGSYCPFNSQATVWWPEVYELLYLPCTVSFRVTDIWRSLVAQRCLHAVGGYLAFLPPTLRQSRNAHDLLRDFVEEIPGYLGNSRIVELLHLLSLERDPSATSRNMQTCYKCLADDGIVHADELPLLDRWLADVKSFRALL
jgi:hypothetical protein